MPLLPTVSKTLLVAIGLTLPGFAGAKILRLTSITFLCEVLCASSMLISEFLLSALDSGLSSMRFYCLVFRKGSTSVILIIINKFHIVL